MIKWLVELCRDEHNKQLGRDAASLMVELAGSELGLLSQEVEKLVAYVGDRTKIEIDDVESLVEVLAETTWVLVNAVRDGDLPNALVNLDKLLNSGEMPERILGESTSSSASWRSPPNSPVKVRSSTRLSLKRAASPATFPATPTTSAGSAAPKPSGSTRHCCKPTPT